MRRSHWRHRGCSATRNTRPGAAPAFAGPAPSAWGQPQLARRLRRPRNATRSDPMQSKNATDEARRPVDVIAATADRHPRWRPSLARLAGALRHESAIFLLGAGVIALHVVDDNFLQPQPGVAAGDHLVS